MIQATFSQTLSTFGGHESRSDDTTFALRVHVFNSTHVLDSTHPMLGVIFYLNHLARFPLLLEAHWKKPLLAWQFCWWPFWDGENVTLFSGESWPPTRGWKGHDLNHLELVVFCQPIWKNMLVSKSWNPKVWGKKSKKCLSWNHLAFWLKVLSGHSVHWIATCLFLLRKLWSFGSFSPLTCTNMFMQSSKYPLVLSV